MPFYSEKIKIDKDTPIPLYFQLKQVILESITSGEFGVGEKLTNELKLMEILGIGRSTVRQAINELVSEGYLYREKAKGTFVSKPKIEDAFFQKLESFHHEMQKKGLNPSTKVLDIKKINGIQDINKKLHIEPEKKLIYLKRLRFADEEPVVYLETYLPYEKYPQLLNVDFEKESLYLVLQQQYNCQVMRAVREIEATLANAMETEPLGLIKGSAICLVKTLAYAQDGQPIEYSVARYRGDRNKFTVELVRSKDEK